MGQGAGRQGGQLPITNAQFPMPHAQLPMPNSQCPMPNYQFLIFCFWHFLSSITDIPAPANIIPAFGGSGTATDAFWLFLVAQV
ncbi:hypothetical protein [Tolypothrix sp. VBCCA 56010]|uniref:hypothetical protein n=1 Tax=Tolypothrix sp. VBCCA 56010 TaxID=3137731 RepID=UPI003D7E71DE